MRLLVVLSLILFLSGCLCCCTGGDSSKALDVSSIQVCKDLDEDDNGVGCASRFDYGINKVYAVLDYTAVDNYDTVDFKWYRGGSLVFTDTFQYEYEDKGDDYYYYTSLPLDKRETLPKGSYEIKVYQDGTLLLAEKSFTIS